MKVLVLINKEKDEDLVFTKDVIGYLAKNSFEVFLESDIYNEIKCGKEISDQDLSSIDFSLVLGGDGTVLNKAYDYRNYDFNFLGINLGRVGCLTEGRPEEYKEIIDKIVKGNYKIEKRIILEGSVKRKGKSVKDIYALNEVTLIRAKNLKMLNIGMTLNHMHDTNFYADGLIVSTPTGSSAYNLSSGGPLLISTADSFVITPICPQLRTITSLVVDGSDEICISLNDNNSLPSLEIDGRESFDIKANDEIVLKKSDKSLNVVKVNLNESLYEPIFKVTNTFSN